MNNCIFIDLTALSRTITGIENYTLNLCCSLMENMPHHFKCHLLFRKEIHPAFIEYQGHHTLSISPFKSQFITEQFYIPMLLLLNKFYLCFFPCFPPGFIVKKRIITICYDAAMWKFRHTLSLKNKMYFRPLSERALKNAKTVFTISDSSQKDIEDIFPIVKGKIFNISAALPTSFSGHLDGSFQEVSRKYSIKGKYFITVGSIEPRKNLQFLLETIAPILKNKEMKLVLVGRTAWGSKELENRINELNISNFLIKTGYISIQELRILYKNAECFIFPSLYEGFGFPILEAFSCDCPVITSNVSSMPFVAGKAALLVDPTNSQMLKEAILNIVTSQDLKSKLVIKGREQLKLFTWEKCAKDFIKVISAY